MIIIFITLLLVILLFYSYKNRETFLSLDNLSSKTKLLDNTKLLTSARNANINQNISILGKQVDDTALTEFIKLQLGKNDGQAANSYNTKTALLDYPTEDEVKEKEQNLPELMENKDNIDVKKLSMNQIHKINKKRIEQNTIIKNLKYELIKILDLRKDLNLLRKKKNISSN